MTKCTDIGALLPSFQPYVRRLVVALEERGFRPVVNETVRTRERAAMLAKDPDGPGPRKPVGIDNSMHCHGAAVDFRCGEHEWDCDDHGCGFYAALGEISTDMGLYWGGHWEKPDRPHVQAIPPTPTAQDKLRSLATCAEKDAFVAARLRIGAKPC